MHKRFTMKWWLLLIVLIVGSGLALVIALYRIKNFNFSAVQYPYLIQEIKADPGHLMVKSTVADEATLPEVVALRHLGSIYPEDRIRQFPDQSFHMGGVVTVERAPVIHLTDGKKKYDLRSWQTTVADVLVEKQIPEIGQGDMVTPVLDSQVVNELAVKITRVQETDILEKQVIAFKTVVKDDPTRYRGEPDVVTQVGQNGQKVLTYHVRREDGEEVSRKLTKTDTTPAKDKIVLHATKLKIGQVLTGNASWYSSRYQAASHIFKRGTNVRVTNTATGKSALIQIQDYMESDDKIIDLNPSIFTQLGAALSQGIQPVKVEEVLN